MIGKSRRLRMGALCVAPLLLAGTAAYAVFPFGGFVEGSTRPIILTWPFRIMDTNRDGDILPGEGIPVVIEIDGNPLDEIAPGFTAEELTIVRDALKVWENVPTSYAAFRVSTSTGLLEAGPDFDREGTNAITITVPGEVNETPLGGGVLGVTWLTAFIEDTVLETETNQGTFQFLATGGQIMEADIIIDSVTHRSDDPNRSPEFALIDTMVHELGHFLGLGHTPLNDLAVRQVDGFPRNIEFARVPMRNTLGETVLRGATPTMFPIAFFVSNSRLIKSQRDEKVIYGTDDRLDVFEVTDPDLLGLAAAVCGLVDETDLVENVNGTFTLALNPYSFGGFPPCPAEPFRTQPTAPFCSGFLVEPDVIATAGHCVTDEAEMATMRFVFGFEMVDSTTVIQTFPANQVYEGVELIASVVDGTGADFALVRLDRPVTTPGVFPLQVRESGSIVTGTPVGVIGHPSGLPKKVAFGPTTVVTNNADAAFFQANLDTYGGNSGSPVFNQETLEVEGILVRGLTDFVLSPPAAPICFESNVLDDEDGGEDVTRASVFLSALPRTGGSRDLAYADIAAITFLYPRSARDEFFEISQIARSRADRPDFPTFPIIGGHVIAWCDTDGNPETPRVPLFNAMTSLFENVLNESGNFRLINMQKRLPVLGSDDLIDATYTFTIEPLNGLDAAGFDPTEYDTLHTAAFGNAFIRGLDSYDLFFTSEVYNEFGNLRDAENFEQGTPLRYDSVRRAVVSADTGKTLSQLLPRGKPMFGEPSKLCPLNIVVSAGLSSGRLPNALRALRDETLLSTPLGSALTDVYYRIAPSLAEFLLEHAFALKAAGAITQAMEWAMDNKLPLAGAAFSGLALLKLLRRRRKAPIALTLAAALIAGAAGFTPSAHALLKAMTTEEMVALSGEIITGTIVSATGREVKGGTPPIVTDLKIAISDSIKGRLSKGTELLLTVPGGRAGNLVAFSPEMPMYRQGEEVLLFIENNKNSGRLVVGGTRGKLTIHTGKSGQRRITGATPEVTSFLKQAAKAIAANKGGGPAASEGIALEDYVTYLRQIVQKQKAEEKRAAAQRE